METWDGRLRIPVKLVDGVWEFRYGGKFPVKEGSIGELLVAKGDVEDPSFAEALEVKGAYKILPAQSDLLAMLVVKPDDPPEEVHKKLLEPEDVEKEIAWPFLENWSKRRPKFFRLKIGSPLPQSIMVENRNEGGLWLITEGTNSRRLSCGKLEINKTVTNEVIYSLNRAFTVLSEKFEPWRKSHTGNAYQRFLYKEKNEKWYPLDTLRNDALHRQEQAIASEFWKRLNGHALKKDTA